VAVTVFAVFGWLGWNLKQVRERASIRPSLNAGERFGPSEVIITDTRYA
jgi:hypothetical protein